MASKLKEGYKMKDEHGWSLLMNIAKAFAGIFGFIMAIIGIRKELTEQKEVRPDENPKFYDDEY